MNIRNKITAIVVCRKGSKRILDKTWKKINGISLIENKINQLKNVSLIDEIVVGSNDEKVLELCQIKNVKHIIRPEYYCDESKCTANEMIKNMLSYVDSDIIVWAHLTNPFIDENHYKEAIDIYLSLDNKHDSLFSAVELREHFWSNDKIPINHNPWDKIHVPAKDIQPLYKQNGGIFIQRKQDMEKNGRFVGDSPYMYIMHELEGWDLDYPWQLEFANNFKTEKN